ncbi:hypothetical protein QJQ45_023947 [Haematococcus lacustris]|nr:hypothetical protein QJQ45_023947 [Haematococcus lacustris]
MSRHTSPPTPTPSPAMQPKQQVGSQAANGSDKAAPCLQWNSSRAGLQKADRHGKLHAVTGVIGTGTKQAEAPVAVGQQPRLRLQAAAPVYGIVVRYQLLLYDQAAPGNTTSATLLLLLLARLRTAAEDGEAIAAGKADALGAGLPGQSAGLPVSEAHIVRVDVPTAPPPPPSALQPPLPSQAAALDASPGFTRLQVITITVVTSTGTLFIFTLLCGTVLLCRRMHRRRVTVQPDVGTAFVTAQLLPDAGFQPVNTAALLQYKQQQLQQEVADLQMDTLASVDAASMPGQVTPGDDLHLPFPPNAHVPRWVLSLPHSRSRYWNRGGLSPEKSPARRRLGLRGSSASRFAAYQAPPQESASSPQGFPPVSQQLQPADFHLQQERHSGHHTHPELQPQEPVQQHHLPPRRRLGLEAPWQLHGDVKKVSSAVLRGGVGPLAMSLSVTYSVFPLTNYSFGAKEPRHERDGSVEQRLARLRSGCEHDGLCCDVAVVPRLACLVLACRFERDGMRRSVEGVLIVHEHNHPHVLLLQLAPSFFKLPGGRLRPGEDEREGLKRKLGNSLSPSNPLLQSGERSRGQSWTLPQQAEGVLAGQGHCQTCSLCCPLPTAAVWDVGEVAGQYWRPNFDTLFYPYNPPHVSRPKECKKVFVVPLPEKAMFAVPRNMRLVAVPLFELYDNISRFGPVISALPVLLSKFRLTLVAPLPSVSISSLEAAAQQQPVAEEMKA